MMPAVSRLLKTPPSSVEPPATASTTVGFDLPTVAILGVRITDIERSTAVALLERLIAAQEELCRTIYVANARTLNRAAKDADFRRLLNAGDFVFGNATGVRLTARQRRIALRDNLLDTDLVPELFAATAGRGYRYFLLGADRDTIHRAAEAARRRFPGWTLAGYHHGYVHDRQCDDVIEQINAAHADLLLVGMGNPLHERWIEQHRYRLHVAVAMGVGGLLDHWGGKVRRASLWTPQLNSDWGQRLLQRPARWCRYLLGNPGFLAAVTRALRSDRTRQS